MSRVITVTSTNVIREGVGAKGPWVLRGVEALDEQGQPIAHQLKTFANLPLGEVEVEIEPQHHEQYGTSFLLKPVRNGTTTPRAGGAGELQALEQRIARLESEVRRLSGLVDRRDPDIPVAASTPGIPDDDIPF